MLAQDTFLLIMSLEHVGWLSRRLQGAAQVWMVSAEQPESRAVLGVWWGEETLLKNIGGSGARWAPGCMSVSER